jgi:hypothetical protein
MCAVSRKLRKGVPESTHVTELRFSGFAEGTQLGHRFTAALDHDDRSICRFSNQFRGSNVKIANGCLPHMLHCSTWAALSGDDVPRNPADW